MDDSKETVVLVTGTNGGLGFSVCCRTVDDFLRVQNEEGRSDTTLTLIFTTRSLRKSKETQSRLELYISTAAAARGFDKSRVTLYPEQCDLSDLFSVRALAARLSASPRFQKIDSLILNAGVTGIDGLSWFNAVWTSLTNPIRAMTWPTYLLATAGRTNPRQTDREDEPVLGHVFTANVFGHYMLTHFLMPLLTVRPQTDPSRVIWVSSIEACIFDFSVDDIQGLTIARSYQSSKYLTDVLALTSELPNTQPWVSKFMAAPDSASAATATATSTSPASKARSQPSMYTCHPGICATGIVPLPRVLYCCMVLAFYICRLLGSPWHVVTAYTGALAPVFLATSTAEKLDEAESSYRRWSSDGAVRGRVKFGSACTRFGKEELACTEVQGWGFGGVVGGAPRDCEADLGRRRKDGAKDLTAEDKEAFIEMGRRCWREMEELREKWVAILEEEESIRERKQKEMEMDDDAGTGTRVSVEAEN
ncbi:60S ribosomal protein L28 [Ascosphaera pollenicola]|nr:60S ribosomal protein L28 [Ascosphaera pollenicola]